MIQNIDMGFCLAEFRVICCSNGSDTQDSVTNQSHRPAKYTTVKIYVDYKSMEIHTIDKIHHLIQITIEVNG